MEAFEPIPPEWTATAVHAQSFCCPACGGSPLQAEKVWVNRRSPVFTEDYRKKWQEFYQCQCGRVWWAWSSDRPPTQLNRRDESSLTIDDPPVDDRMG